MSSYTYNNSNYNNTKYFCLPHQGDIILTINSTPKPSITFALEKKSEEKPSLLNNETMNSRMFPN